MNIEERIEQAKSLGENSEALDGLIRDYKPFIFACASAAAKTSVSQSDAIAGEAMLAFVEAVHKFDAAKGAFLPYCRLTIRHRVYDFLRAARRQETAAVLSGSPYEEDDPALREQSIRAFQVQNIEADLRMEIAAFNIEIESFDISYDSLVSSSPKANKTRKQCLAAARCTAGDPGVLRKLLRTRMLPIKEICEKIRLPYKSAERYRKYIVAVVVILAGDYPYLREYVRPRKNEDD